MFEICTGKIHENNDFSPIFFTFIFQQKKYKNRKNRKIEKRYVSI